MSKPMWAKVEYAKQFGIGARADGDTLYLWSWTPKTWRDNRVRALVLFNNPSFRTIREALQRRGIALARYV